jgi:cell division protein FtsZ
MFKFGAITDDNLGENLRVTIIAAGFDGGPLDGLAGTISPVGDTVIQDPEPQPEQNDTPLDGVLLDEVPQDEEKEELVLVDTDGEEEPEIRLPVDKQTPTNGHNGGKIIVASEPPVLDRNPYKNDTRDTDILELDNEERPSDEHLIQQIVAAFVKNQYLAADLDKPTFERNRTVLYAIPMLAEQDFVRSKLND